MMGVAAYLRALRDARGMSQEKLGDMIGVAGNTIWRIEDGRQEPGGEILLNIVAALRGNYEDVRLLFADDSADESVGRETAQRRLSWSEPGTPEELRVVEGVLERIIVLPGVDQLAAFQALPPRLKQVIRSLGALVLREGTEG